MNAININNEKYTKYNNEKELIDSVIRCIDLGVMYFSQVQKLYANSKASKLHLHDEIKEKFEHYTQEAEELDFPSIHKYYFILKIYVHFSINDHRGIFETAKAAVAHFEQYDVIYVDAVKSFNFYLIESYAKFKDFEKVGYYKEQNIELVQENSFAWFKTYELYAFAALRLGHYETCAETIVMLQSHDLFEHQRPLLRDNLRFMLAFLSFLQETKAYTPKSADCKALLSKPFKLMRFVNDLEVGNADKEGLSVIKILLELSFSVVRGVKDDFFDRIDAVKKYFQRYTDREGDERMLAYFRLFELGVRYDWHKKEIDRYSNAHYDLLRSEESIVNSQRFDIEYIAFDNLFDLTRNNVLQIAVR
jgi:hypothetical protein